MKSTALLILALLFVACKSGEITPQDEPADAADAAGGDGGDAVSPDDGGGPDEVWPDGDAGGDPGQPGDYGQVEEGDAPGDPGPGPATEVLLFDGNGLQFTYDDSGFHSLIQPGDALPAADWLAPVDFYHGEFQVRYVITGPTDQQAGQLQTCVWTLGDDGVGGDYFPESCGQQVPHTGVGTFLVTDPLVPADWWKNQGVELDYSHPERFLVRTVLRGVSGCNVTRYAVDGACWDEWSTFETMTYRETIVLVGAGHTFSGWERYP